MSQTQTLIIVLKKALKAHSLTYRDVAEGLGLSEASVKRTFAEQSFTLNRLEQICLLMDWEITDLVDAMETEKSQISELAVEQEQELVSDIKLLLVAFLVVNGWTAEEIEQHYAFSEHDMIAYLVKLDRLKLIDLLPGNRIKLQISHNFSWLKNGPIQQLFSRQMEKEFFTSGFDKSNEAHMVLSGMLSPHSSAYILKKMQHLTAEFNELNQQDKRLPLDQRFASIMIMALRPWRPTVFEQFRRAG
jgi:transcriptional regulator with XRE-family HTH domain